VVGLDDRSWGGIPLPLDLGPLGAPGCSLYTDRALGLVVPNTGGGSAFALTIPAAPRLVGATTHWQGLFLAPLANPLGLATSDYLSITLGP
jgi:hypothetical protein